jgi:hypothetical protein
MAETRKTPEMEGQPGRGAADSSSSASPTNWRKEVDERLRRLHSLLFGADAALERGNSAAAQALALRLLGFLDSQTFSTDAGPEAAFVAPIRAAASSRLAAASRVRVAESDRYTTYPANFRFFRLIHSVRCFRHDPDLCVLFIGSLDHAFSSKYHYITHGKVQS